MEKIKGIFFDFDDTLQDREKAYTYFCSYFLDKYFPCISPEEKALKMGEMEENCDGGYIAREKYFPILFDLWGWENHPPLESLCREFNLKFGEKVALFPEVRELLAYLKDKGYKLGVITNGVSVLQNMKLDSSGLRGFFDCILVSGDCQYAKPDPRLFLLGCEKAGLSPEECAFIGDHPVNDIKGAIDAGMMPVRMNFGTFYNQGMFEGVRVIESLEELYEIF